MIRRWILCGLLVVLSVGFAGTAVLWIGQNEAQEQAAQQAVVQILEPLETTAVEATETPWYGEEYFAVVEIPALELVLPVLDHYTEPELKKTPCLYSGSIEGDDMVITAHNYRHHFGRLVELELGAELTLRTKSESFGFRLAKIEELAPTDVEPMTVSQWPLTLYTCAYDQNSMLTLRWEHLENMP